jgi:NitT/TauT family transport system substrate-binding protein
METRSLGSRRGFLSGLTAAGVALAGLAPRRALAQPPPETTTLRLAQFGSLCISPQYVAEELLRAEGFAEIQYLPTTAGELYRAIAAGRAHLSLGFVGPAIIQIDAGNPLVLLAGVHPGCYEVFGTERVRTIRDFRGKTIAITAEGGGQQIFLSTMLAYVGLDPRRDVAWVSHPPAEAIRLLAEGKVDGYLGFPPEPQELRARKIGHVILNTAVDRPWSQYYCCLVVGHRDFVRRHPVATKRAIRALLKAADLCALEPARAARAVVDKGYEPRYDYALQVMRDIPYGKWREYNPEDSVRFFSLRLREAGLIRSNPKEIIAEGTDWRFLDELRRELKG